MQNVKQFAGRMRRHWRVALIVSVVVFALAMLSYERARTVYRIETNYLVSHDPLASTLEIEEERYYHWVMSEYVAYSLADWSQGTDFAERVRDRISADFGVKMEVDEVADAISAGAIRSRLIVAFATLDESKLEMIATAGYAEIVDVNAEGLDVPQFTLAEPRLQPLDPEFVMQEIDPTLGQTFALPLRIISALVAGFAAAVYITHRDPTIDDRRSLQPLKLPILGEIPSI